MPEQIATSLASDSQSFVDLWNYKNVPPIKTQKLTFTRTDKNTCK